MKSTKTYTIIRVLLGIAWIFFGIEKFFPPSNPPIMPQPAMDFLASMVATGYFIPLLGLTELLVGLLLLFNKLVPLAMVILAPIMLNIILFNVFLAPSVPGIIMITVLLLLQGYIVAKNWDSYKNLFR